MPTYEYKCPKCGTLFEQFQKITSKPEAPCPKCGAKAVRLISGGHGIVFKGSGFYETDYKRPAEKAKRKQKDEGGGSAADKPSPSKPDPSPAKPKAD